MREIIIPIGDNEVTRRIERVYGINGELIRCRDCANYDDNKNYCNVWKATNQPNDGFCHFAERKTNVKPDTAE